MRITTLLACKQKVAAPRWPGALWAACLLAFACQPAAEKAAAPAPGPAPLAHLEQLTPQASVRPSGAAADVPASSAMALFAGDLVKTQKNGAVDVVFTGNNRIHLGPDATLLLEEHGGEGAELGAVVLQGAVRASAGAAGVGLRLRSPVGTARLGGAKVSVLDVSMDRGLAVQLGEVALEQPDNRGQVALQVGQVITMATAGSADGLVVSSFAPSADLAPMTFSVPEERYGRARGLRGAAQLQGRDNGAWQPVLQATALGNGDTLHVAGGGAVEVALGDHARVTVLGDTNVAFRAADITADHHHYAFAVGGGSVNVQAERAPTLASQALLVAGTEMKVTPGVARADVMVSSDGNRAEVVVRYGEATLANGEQLRGGQRATIEGGKLTGPPRPAFAGAIGVAEGKPAVVYYRRSVPPIRFEARSGPGAGTTVAFARDAAIATAVAKEHLTDASFVTDDVKAGRTWWRIGDGGPTPLDLVEEPERSIDRAARQTDLDDNGAAAHIYYQNVLPNIRLNWAEVQRAKAYEVVIAAQREPNAVAWSQQISAQSVAVPPEIWHDGRFVWRVTPIGADQRRLTRPRENLLRLSHDTDVHGLRLRAPVGGAGLAAAAVTAEGDVEPGCELLIGGQKATIDAKSRFKQSVALHRGDNQLVFRLVKPGRPDRIYLRTVRRDG